MCSSKVLLQPHAEQHRAARSSTSSSHLSELAAVTWLAVAVSKASSTFGEAALATVAGCGVRVNVGQGCAVVAAAAAVVHGSREASLQAAAAAGAATAQ
jgi:hypothetical protein